MGIVRRIYVEKKEPFAVKAKELHEEIGNFLGIQVEGVRVFIRYDVENISDEVFERACKTVFSEPPVDFVYEEDFPKTEEDTVFSVEYLPGQFDQRADSAEQCVKLLKEDEEPVIRSATTYVLSGTLTEEQVKIETARCLGCGATIVDENKCIGCGVCTTKCEFDAITLHRDRPECTRMVTAEDKFKEIIPYQLKRAARIVTHKKS